MLKFKEIYQAYTKCKKLKRNIFNNLNFELDLIENLCNLETSLNNKTYTFKKSICFATSSTKLKKVFAGDFQDKLVYRIIASTLDQICELSFINDSYKFKNKSYK